MTQVSTTLVELYDLSGKVAVVTGGSRGIGRAIAQRLAEAGAYVVVSSRKLEACEAAAAEISASTGRRAVVTVPRADTHLPRFATPATSAVSATSVAVPPRPPRSFPGASEAA